MKIVRFILVLVMASFGHALVAQGLTTAELEKMVRELDAVGTRHPTYAYPIKCSVVVNKEVNAYASIEPATKKDEKPRAIMVVYSGLVEFAKGDLRVIRAVVAHEVAHLMQGHVASPRLVASDLRFLWDRQQEMDADLTGAILLEKAGYSRKDMMDMLALLDQNEEETSWIWRLAKNDHTSAKNRAAEVGGNNEVLRSMMCFEKGLAFMECRRYSLAAKLFDQAVKLAPEFLDAYTNAAQASLMDYYDSLPLAVQNRWFLPDFGPVLTDNPIGPKGLEPEIREEDRERFRIAMQRIAAARAKRADDPRVEELAFLARALDPDATNASLIETGDVLSGMSKTGERAFRIRTANNAGVAYHRAGELGKAHGTIFGVLKETQAFSSYLAQNLGRFANVRRSKEEEILVLDVLVEWLNNAPLSNPYYRIVRDNYAAGCKRAGVKELEIRARPTYLCTAVSLNVGGKEAPLLVETSDYVDAFGEPPTKVRISEQYPDVQAWIWPAGELFVLTERGQVVKVATHAPGAYVDLRPSDPASNLRLRVSVGMSEEEFAKILDLSKAVETKVAGATGIETWSYYPSLMIGVQRKDKTIVGLAVNPVSR